MCSGNRPRQASKPLVHQLVQICSLKNLFQKRNKKNLNLKIILSVEFAMSLVGVTFSSIIMKLLIQNFTAMNNKIKTIVIGVALVG